jgi:predicted RNA-binding Zn-ribbon protein involved in translation (DUF1610 family)
MTIVGKSSQEKSMLSADLLRRLRNDLPMAVTLAALGRQGPPAKISEGYLRFLCPRCGEMLATVNPRNNLAHCFCCQNNFNNIDLVMTLDHDFRTAVALLEGWLQQYQSQPASKATPPSAR